MWWRRLLVILRRMSVGIALGILLTVIVASLGWLLAGDWVAGRLTSYANTKFFADSGTRVTVGRVTGSVWSDMVFEKVQIEREVDGSWGSAITADRIEARYDLPGLIRGRPDFSAVRVFSPVIELASDSTGRIVLPIGNRPGDQRGEGLKSLSMRNIVVQDGVFRFSGRSAGFEATHLFAEASLEVKGGGVDLRLEQASMELLDPIGKIEQVSGRILVAGRNIQGENLALLWEGSRVGGSFRWNPADSLAGFVVAGEFERLDLDRIRQIAENDLIPRTGTASGRVALNGSPAKFTFESDVSGMWGSHPVDTLSVAGTRDGATLQFDRLRLKMPEYDIAQAVGTLVLAGTGHLDAAVDFNSVQLDSVPFDAVRWIEGKASGNMKIVLDGFIHQSDPVSGDIRLDLDPTEVFGLRLNGVDGRIRFVEGRDALIEAVTLKLPDGGQIVLDGAVHPDGRLDLDVTGDTSDWSQLAPLIVVPGLAGSGSARGTLTGTGERPVIDMSGRFTGVHGWGMVVDSLDMTRLYGPVLPKPELAGEVSTRGLVALGRKIERADLQFNWKEPRLTLTSMDIASFDTTASGTGWVEFDPTREAMVVQLSNGHLAMGRFDWIPDRDIVVTGVGARYTLSEARWTSAAGSALLSGIIDAERGRMDMTADEMDIDLLVLSGDEAPPELGGGRLSGRLRLNGPNNDPDPSGVLRLTNFRWGPGTIDSASADFEATGGHVTLRQGMVTIGEGSAVAEGGLDLPASAWVTFNDWLDKKPVAWERVDLHDLVVTGTKIDLPSWLAFQPPPESVYGTLDGRVLLNGHLSEPTLAGDMVLAHFEQGAWSLDSLAVTGTIRPEEAHIEKMILARSGSSARVSGKAPIRLSFYPFKIEQPNTPMDLAIDLTEADLSLLPPTQFGLEEAGGNLEGSVRLTGTPTDPRVAGEIRILGGRLRALDREEVIEDLSARIVFEGNTARLIDLTARQGQDGTVSGSGLLPLSTQGVGTSTLKFDVRKFVIRQSGEYAVRFDGDFTVDLISDGSGGLRPFTRGSILIDRAEVIRELNQTSPPAEPGQTYDYEMTVDAPARIYIVNSTVEMELSGDLLARQQAGRFEMVGTMDIIRGYYTMLLRRFKILAGRLTFSRVDAIDPDIDITAETNDAEYIITVRITGQASNPKLSFSARRPNDSNAAELSEQQILNRLAPGSAIAQSLASQEGTKSQAGIDVLAGSVQMLFSQVQRDLAHSLGVDELRYDTPGATNPGDDPSYGRLSVLKSLTPDVTVSYSQELGASGNELSVEYRLGRLLFLRGEVARRQATELREEYGIDLRLWHEY